MRVVVIDNGGQWTHREWRVLKYLGVDAEILPNTLPPEKIVANGLVLSGGAPRIETEMPKLGMTARYLDEISVPILGICVGAQFTAIHFGGSAGPADDPEYGNATVHIDDHNKLFKGLPDSITAWESHNDEIKGLPDSLVGMAHSESCAVQAFRHRELPIYGLQFHPEVEHTEHGADIFRNFVDICRAHADS